VLPNWVDLRPAGGQTFGLLPRVADGDLWLRWRASAGQKEAAGAIHIDLKSGKVEMLAADKMPPPPPPALALSAALTKLARRDYETPAGPETNVLTAGNFAAAVDLEKAGANRKVVLRRWDTATEVEQDRVTLAEGRDPRVFLLPGSGMLAIRPAEGGRWRLFSLETGKLRASVQVERGAIDAAVVGGRFFYSYAGPPPPNLNPANTKPGTRVVMLKAVDLETGREVWWKPLDPSNPFWSFLYGNTPPPCPDDP
jgi:hypothetical protein